MLNQYLYLLIQIKKHHLILITKMEVINILVSDDDVKSVLFALDYVRGVYAEKVNDVIVIKLKNISSKEDVFDSIKSWDYLVLN